MSIKEETKKMSARKIEEFNWTTATKQTRWIFTSLALFGPVGVAVGCALKYVAIFYRRQEIKQCIQQIKKDWNQIESAEDHEIMIKNVRTGNKVTTLCATFMYTGGISHQVMAPFLPGSIISIVDNSTKRPLIYPVYDTMFETQETPVYEMVYSSHILMGVVVCSMTTGICNLGAIFVTHASSQNQRMISKLEKLTNIKNNTENNSNKQMSAIIHLHNKIIKQVPKIPLFSSDIEQVLREICMIGVLESIYFICMAEYYSITAWRNNEKFGAIIYLILVTAFTFNCFIFCYIGELLKDQFHKAGEAVYMTEWYYLSKKNARALALIIAITQHPPKITAGGLMELSYNGFITNAGEAVYMTEWYRLSHKNARAMILIIAITQHPPTITAGGLMELSYNGFVFVLKTTAAYFNILRMVEL
ncbi:hypothetical protein PV325_003071 [Microctonus aethiopoides]|nr:hypothetical protein PV325_003071 [Microctonus aethiopoides]